MNFAESISQMQYGKSSDPAHPDNDSQDFQDGYIVGSLRDISERHEDPHEIETEYHRRGDPEDKKSLAAFKDWKRGYWAGVFSQINLEK